MSYSLRGAGWVKAAHNPDVTGVFLFWIRAGGHQWFVSTKTTEIRMVQDGQLMKFIGVAEGVSTHEERIDIFSRQASVASMSLSVPEDFFPLNEIRRAGIYLQDIKVEAFWIVDNVGLSLDQALKLVTGDLSSPSYDENSGRVSFTIIDRRLDGDEPFPPIVHSDVLIAAVAGEASGKPYPVVYGAVEKLPIYATNAANTQFLVMHDPHNATSGTPVTSLYDGDLPVAVASQDAQTDLDGNGWWRALIAVGIAARDMSADVTGVTPADIESVVWHLITFYSTLDGEVDQSSLPHLKSLLGKITLTLVINQRIDKGALAFIKGRLTSKLPFAMIQRETKYGFWPVTWTREVSKTLSFDSNIVRKISPPSETPRESIYNAFTFKYGRSGFRGDYAGVLTLNASNNRDCFESKQRYGLRAMPDVDLGDVADLASASLVAEWYIETFSKPRVFVSYECTLDIADVALLDTVVLDDEREGWTHGPLFKVVGLTRMAGPTMGISLVSVDDIHEVYNVNRWNKPTSSYTHTFVVPPIGGDWGDGVPDYNDSDPGDWGDGGPG